MQQYGKIRSFLKILSIKSSFSSENMQKTSIFMLNILSKKIKFLNFFPILRFQFFNSFPSNHSKIVPLHNIGDMQIYNSDLSYIKNIRYNMKADQKKYHQYSLSFYQRQKDLVAVSNRVKLGFSHFDKNEKSLKPKSVENFIRFNERNKYNQKLMLQEDPEAYIDAFVDIILNLNRDRDLMEYVLSTLDAILTEERGALRELIEGLRKGKYNSLLSKLKSFISLEDHREVTVIAASRVAAIILGQLPIEQFFNDQRLFLLDLLQIKKSQRQVISDYALVTCFVHLNKHSGLAQVFLQNGGGSFLVECLTRSGNDIQLIYYSLLNIWMLSFSDQAIEKFISVGKLGVIKSVCEILQKVSREKITRVAFMIFKNIEKEHSCLELMMDNKLLKIIDTILKGNIKDEELINSIKDIATILQSNIRVLSSFDKYVKEINSDSLEWSSVHNERFWKENAIKFEANDYQLVKKLKYLLSSKKPLNAAIACYDLGEFCRFYPRGKAVIETLQIKDIIMEKARFSDDKSVREQALLALQKIMIQNWQAI